MNNLVNLNLGKFVSRLRLGTPVFNYTSTHADSYGKLFGDQLTAIEQAGTYKNERIIVSPQSPVISVSGDSFEKAAGCNISDTTLTPDSQGNVSVLNFCANNYLGLANHPKVIDNAKSYMDTHGFGLSSVRFICGTQDIHKEFESTISTFLKTEDTILYSSCFDANAGFLESIGLTENDTIISDSLNHASIIDGLRLLRKPKRKVFDHLNYDQLESQLKESPSDGFKCIVTDSVFSMDGDYADLSRLINLAENTPNTLLWIDESHATGFVGEGGRGVAEKFGILGHPNLIITSTLGKALGGASGGFLSGRKDLVDLLRNKSRPYLFSNSLAPPCIGGSIKAIELIQNDPSVLQNLRDNTSRFRSRMTEAGFTLSGKDHPIAPVMLYDEVLAAKMSDSLLKEGIFAVGFSFPVVPKGQARIRVQLSGAHSIEQVDKAVDAFIAVGKDLSVI